MQEGGAPQGMSPEEMMMFDAPIPGESLTSDPETRMPYERPPQIVDQQEAVEDLFLRMTDPDTLDDILDLMRAQTPIEDISQVILFEGFRQGMYTPDMYILLIEPSIYMLLALAEYAQIDAVLDPEDDTGLETPEEAGSKALANINNLRKNKTTGETGEEVAFGDGEAIEAGDRVFAKPASITPNMLEVMRSRVGGGTDNG